MAAFASSLLLLPGCASSGIAPSYPGTLVLVADDANSELLEIEPNSGHVRQRYAVAGPVVGIATARNGQYAATIDAEGRVVVCDLARQGRDAAWRVAGVGRATGLVFADRRSTLAASFAGSGDVVLVGRESGRVEARIATGCASVLTLARAIDGETLLAGCSEPNGIVRLDVEQARIVERVEMSAAPNSIAAGDFERSRSSGRTDDAREASLANSSVASDFAGRVLVASSSSTGELIVVHDAADSMPVRIPVGGPERAATTAWPVAVDPDGKNAFVSIPRAGRVVVVDLRTNLVRGAFEVGGAPGAIAWTRMRAPPEVGLDSGLR